MVNLDVPEIPRYEAGCPASDTPAKITSIYEKVTQIGLERKLLDICVSRAMVPHPLAQEAMQEIRLAWSLSAFEDCRSDGEAASYAFRIGVHAALRVRREIGAPVALPGSAFRKKRDGSTYVQPGHLAKPQDWSAMEEWFSGHLSPELPADVEDDTPLAVLRMRREVSTYADHLSPRQQKILNLLIDGYELDDIAVRLHVGRLAITRDAGKARRLLESLRGPAITKRIPGGDPDADTLDDEDEGGCD